MSLAKVNQKKTLLSHKLGIWRDRNFLRYWVGQTVSVFGTQVTLMALPMLAILELNVTPFELGVLYAVEYAPFLIFGLFAGVWVDQMPKRPLLITADFGRAVLLGIIPLMASFHLLNMEILWVVAFMAGILTTFYAIGNQSILPFMIEKKQLTEGNAKVELSRSISEMAGPGFAGLMVQLLTASFAVLLDSFSFMISGLMLCFISVDEPKRTKDSKAKSRIWRDMGEGLKLVFNSPYLRSIAACSGTLNFFTYMIQAIILLYATKELGFSTVTVGGLLTLGTTGAILSAMMGTIWIKRFGYGPVITGAACIQGIGCLFLLGAVGNMKVAYVMMFLSRFIIALATTLYNVAQVSFRQSITETEMLGRMNATMRTIVWGTIPLGSLAGGALGTWIGIYPTIVVAALGCMFSFLFVFLSPVRTVAIGSAGNVGQA